MLLFLKRKSWWCWWYSNWEKGSNWAVLQLWTTNCCFFFPHYLWLFLNLCLSLGGKQRGRETEPQSGLPAATLTQSGCCLISQVFTSCSRGAAAHWWARFPNNLFGITSWIKYYKKEHNLHHTGSVDEEGGDKVELKCSCLSFIFLPSRFPPISSRKKTPDITDGPFWLLESFLSFTSMGGFKYLHDVSWQHAWVWIRFDFFPFFQKHILWLIEEPIY